MRRIGIIGGMSWESTATYYRRINEMVADKLGGYHSADIVMASVDFDPIERMQRNGDWDAAAVALATRARELEAACADVVILATNTMHKVADHIRDAIQMPFIHIADAVAAETTRAGVGTLGLLGTRFTMEEDFYRGYLEQEHGLSVIVPDEQDRAYVDRVIFMELVHGQIREESRRRFLRICAELQQRGADAVIEGCTEIGMLLPDGALNTADPPDMPPLIDSTEAHCKAVVDFALSDQATIPALS